MTRLIPSIFAALPIALLITGASAQTNDQSTATETETNASEATASEATQTEQTESPAPDVTATTVIATVDETPITLGEVIAVRQSLPEQYQGLPDEVLLEALIQQLADQQLLANAAEAEGLQNLDVIKMAIRNQRRAILADAYMTEALIARVNDSAVEAAYKAEFVDAEPVIEMRAAHILVEEEQTARDLKQQLDDGADFAALAADHGTDGTSTRGGDLGWFTREMMVPEFADAVVAMEAGQIAGPVKTPFGWHVIKLDEVRNRPVPPLDEVRADIVGSLTEEMQGAIISEARDSGKIVRVADDLPPSAIRLDELLRN